MKKTIIKIIFMLLILIILFSINTKVFAWDPIIESGKDFMQAGEGYQNQTINTTSLKDLSSYLYNILLAAGIVIAVVVATVLGIQFMMGGAEGQAKVKEMLVPFIVGCVIVFGGFGFWKIAITVGQKLENSSTTYQPDFSQSRCSRCGTSVEPTYDKDKKQYICPSCGNIRNN